MHYDKQSSHVGSSLSCVEILKVISKLGSRDKFILSKGHAASAIYATLGLHKHGYPTHAYKTSFVDYSSGSLGHGLSYAAGMAIAGKKPIVVLGDGECDEGQNYEAIRFIGEKHLDVIAVVDCNGFKGYDRAQPSFVIAGIFETYGWSVLMVDGHNEKQLESSLRYISGPLAIIALTKKGYGLKTNEGTLDCHYKPPTKEDLQ